MNNKYWAAIIVGLWALTLLTSSFYRHPNDWFDVSQVHVSDTVEGQQPEVRYSRGIKKKFRGTWLVEVNEVTSGGLKAICSAQGSNYYEPGNYKPSTISLQSLMGGKSCTMQPAEYVIDIVWTVRPAGSPLMEIVRTSNTFEVLPRGE